MSMNQQLVADKVKEAGQSLLIDLGLLDRSLDLASLVVLNEQTYDLLSGHRENIGVLLNDFCRTYGLQFVGTGLDSSKNTHAVIEQSNLNMLKASTTLDWLVTPTGRATFDEIIPETASQVIRLLNSTAKHWFYLANIMEIGSANNTLRLYLANLNGDTYGRVTVWAQARMNALKVIPLPNGKILKERGTINIDAECMNASPVEIVPFGIHFLPHEIAASSTPNSYVENAA